MKPSKATKPKKKFEKPQGDHFSLTKEILGVAFIALGVFFFISFFWPETTGAVGIWLISTIMMPVVGAGVYVLPAFLAFLGLALVFGREINALKRRILGLCLMLLSVITLWDIFTFQLFDNILLEDLASGGGFLGRLFNYLLHWTGIAGANVILIAQLLIGSMLAFNFSWQRFHEKLEISRAEKKVAREEAEMLRAEQRKLHEEEKRKLKATAATMAALKTPATATPPADLNNEFSAEKRYKDLGKKQEEKLKTNSGDQIFAEISANQSKDTPDGYQLPPLSLLEKIQEFKPSSSRSPEDDIRTLEATLASFNVEAKVVEVSYGPSLTRYELEPGHGVRINKIANLADDIALSLASTGVRIQAPVPGKAVVGIEIPNKEVRPVNMMEVVATPEFQKSTNPLFCALGKDVADKPVFLDLARMPHVLIAGATGSGKSVCVNSLITSILLKNRPDEVRFIMIDPKKVELSLYNGIPHLLTPVVTDPKLASVTLKNWAIKEMERRYDEFSLVGVKNLEGYNQYIDKIWENDDRRSKSRKQRQEKSRSAESVADSPLAIEEEEIDIRKQFKKIPYIVVVIDELADLMMVASGDVESSIIRLAQLARATGIHLIIATQRPSVNVITGLIKANVPSRIAFAVSSQIDSRTILDNMGAEKLLGRGDMLYSPVGVFKPMRLQGVFLSDAELNRVISHVKNQGQPEYDEELEKIDAEAFDIKPEDSEDQDPLWDEARMILKAQAKPSISFLQRKLRIGYNRAARLFEDLEAAGEVFRDVGGE